MAVGFVRPARPDDAGEIARIQLTTWRVAYRRLLPRHILDELDEAWLAERWLDAVTAPPTLRHRVLVAVEQSVVAASALDRSAVEQSALQHPELERSVQEYVVGFAASGPPDETALAADSDDMLADDVAAVTDLLVEPRWGRRGHGSRLLAASVDLWRADKFQAAVAWSFDADAATRKFLTSAGWAPDGATRALDVDDLLVPQLRLHCTL